MRVTDKSRGSERINGANKCQANERRIGDCLRRFLRHSTFDIRHSLHILLIPGTSSLEHLRENVMGAALQLPNDALQELNAIAG